MRIILALIGIAISFGCLQGFQPEQSNPNPSPASSQRTLLNRYCITCHNEKLKTAGLMLDKMDVEHVSANAEVWEKVVRKLRTGAMPPAGMPRPDKADYDSLASSLETALDRAAEAKPNPGRPVVHRLNRAEYTNAIRDLLAVDIDGESLLPSDDSDYGFDNIGAVLSVSPTLLERYMAAAGKISRIAIGDPTVRPVAETYNVPDFLMQDDRMSEDLPFGSRGGIAIRHYFPVDAVYVIRIHLQRNKATNNYIRGLGEEHQLEVRLDGARVKLFTVGGEHKGKSAPLYADPAIRGDPEQDEYERHADDGLEVQVPVKAGTRLVGVAFMKEGTKLEGELEPRPVGFGFGGEYHKYKGGDPAVSSVTIEALSVSKEPGETPSRRRIFVCHPTGARAGTNEEEQCARQILSALARRAYRRPVTDGDIQPLLGLYKAGRGQGFEAGISLALRGILGSPGFLFRIERDPPNVPPDTAYRISDIELASRLSFFLWSSIPDDQLLDLAEHGRLKDSAVLERQVLRMLDDPRSNALVTNFAGQWLYLRNLRSALPDIDAFPSFDENLREGFQQETELFLQSVLREGRSVLDLMNANYTFVNERLARHYGIPNVYGSHFQRVTLSNEERRGLLGQGSILMVTSYDNRTSPVLRGKFLLENFLGTPPPPPPANVPSLKDRGEDGKMLSMRQQMEQHRANPACASCHVQMDPLGFAFENFDVIGSWRTTSGVGNTPIDSSGALPDGTRFQGPADVRKILLTKPDRFVTTLTEKLLTYALGRGIEYYDEPAIRRIVRNAAPSDYRWSSLIVCIVKSTPFQMRRSQLP